MDGSQLAKRLTASFATLNKIEEGLRI